MDEGAYAEPFAHCATAGAVPDTLEIGLDVAAGAGVDVLVCCEGETRTMPAKPVLDVESVALSEIADVLERFCSMPSPDHVLVGPTSRVQSDALDHVAPVACGILKAIARSLACDG